MNPQGTPQILSSQASCGVPLCVYLLCFRNITMYIFDCIMDLIIPDNWGGGGGGGYYSYTTFFQK